MITSQASVVIASNPGPHHHQICAVGKRAWENLHFVWGNKGLRFDLLRFRKLKFRFSVMEHWDLLPGVDPKNYLYNRCGLSCFTKKRLRLCQVEEVNQTNTLQGRLRLQLLGLLPWWQTEHAFGVAHLSELTHCLARIYIPSFEQCKQITATLARRFLCGTGVAPAKQEERRRVVFSPTGKCATKKKNRKQETEEGKTFCSERTVNFEPKSQRFLNQIVFVNFLSSAPFLSMHVEASTSPKLGFALYLYCTLTSSACAGQHLDVFGCQKQTWKRHSRLTILSGNLTHYSG